MEPSRKRWSRPSARAFVVAGGILLLWVATGYWTLAYGNGRTVDLRVACGTLIVHIGREPSAVEKWYCARGFEFGTAYEFTLAFGDVPWIWIFERPPSVMGELPLWVVCPPLAALVLLMACRRRRYSADSPCYECGYDLTGNTSGRCPECGASVEKSRGRDPKR
jgi:hypothetical protein